MFECSVIRKWYYLGSFRRYGLVKESMSLGVSFEVSNDSFHSQYVFYYFLHVDQDGSSRLFLLPCLCCVIIESNLQEP